MSRLSGREQAVWDKRNAGLTFKQIAKDLGLCVQTVSFAYRKAERKVEYEKERLKPTELEVYKRALKLVLTRVAEDNDIEFNEQEDIKFVLEEARKELEDDE